MDTKTSYGSLGITIKALFQKYHKIIDVILSLIVFVLVVYLLVVLTTKKPSISPQIQQKIDTLEVKTKNLEHYQKQLDSLIRNQNGIIKSIDSNIKNVKEKTTIIREHYHDTIKLVNNYNYDQLDSFFKARYNY